MMLMEHSKTLPELGTLSSGGIASDSCAVPAHILRAEYLRRLTITGSLQVPFMQCNHRSV